MSGRKPFPTDAFNDVNDARELIGMAIGAGSMCWVGGTGDLMFDSETASEVMDAAHQRLQKLLADSFREPVGDWCVYGRPHE